MGIKHYILGLALALFFASGLVAQTKPQVHKINGNKYYLHVVEKGNTLYGISQLYTVSIEEIQKENKDALKEGLKEHQTLLIPVTSDNKRELAPVEQKQDFLIHKVQPKETLYSICKQYNSKLEEVLKANPELESEGLKADSEIKIPVEKIQVRAELKKSAKPDSLDGHKVEKGETLYSLSKRYNVAIVDLEEVNGFFPLGLKEGMMIRIPGTVNPTSPSIDTVGIVSDSLDTIPSPVIFIPDSTGSFQIGLLLPMNPVFPDSTSKDFQVSGASRVALSFYRGFKYAIDSVGPKYNLNLNVILYSAGKDSGSLERVFQHKDFDSLDVLVGPLYTDQFEVAADRLAPRGVPVICPVPKPSKLLFQRPNAIKTTPSESMQLNSMAEFVASEMKDSTVILVNSNKFQDQENVEFFKTRYAKAMGVPDTFTGETIKEVKFWDINFETLKMRFPDSGSYVLIVPSTNPVFITNFLAQLNNLCYETKNMYQFRLIGMGDWQKLDEDIDIRHLHNLNVTLPLVSYVDLRSYKVSNFYKNYYNDFGFQPDEFTLQGFDLAQYLMEQLAYRPKQWFASPEDYVYNGVVEVFNFKRILPGSGIENQCIKFYEYDNYRLKEYAQWPLLKSK